MNAYIPVMSCVTYLSCSYSFHTNHKKTNISASQPHILEVTNDKAHSLPAN